MARPVAVARPVAAAAARPALSRPTPAPAARPAVRPETKKAEEKGATAPPRPPAPPAPVAMGAVKKKVVVKRK
jgi:hypothetical protein